MSAVPLVLLEGETFQLQPQGVAALESIDEELAVVVVTGAYRSGKSFLCNVLVGAVGEDGGDATAFQVGSTVKSCTQGIWVNLPPVEGEFAGGQRRRAVVVLDTEGLGSTNRNAQYDDRIFTLATLLASKLIYNSLGSIDEKSIQRLSFVAALAKLVSKSGPNSAADAGDMFPSFTWVLRDFQLRLVDKDGAPMAPPQYLEENLANLKGFSKDIMVGPLSPLSRRRRAHRLPPVETAQTPVRITRSVPAPVVPRSGWHHVACPRRPIPRPRPRRRDVPGSEPHLRRPA